MPCDFVADDGWTILAKQYVAYYYGVSDGGGGSSVLPCPGAAQDSVSAFLNAHCAPGSIVGPAAVQAKAYTLALQLCNGANSPCNSSCSLEAVCETVQRLVGNCDTGNIFYFGDSWADPGNFNILNPQLPADFLNTSGGVISGGACPTAPPNSACLFERINSQFTQANIYANGQALANIYGYPMRVAFNEISVPANLQRTMYNYAISGAGIVYQTYIPDANPNTLAVEALLFGDQIATGAYVVTNDDAFVVTNLFANDGVQRSVALLQAFFHIPVKYPGFEDPVLQWTTLVIDTFTAQLQSLIDLGALHIYIVASDNCSLLPTCVKFTNAIGGLTGLDLAFVNSQLAALTLALRAAVDVLTAPDGAWADIDIVILSQGQQLDELADNAALYGVQLPLNKTMVDAGWDGGHLHPNLLFYDDSHATSHTHDQLSTFLVRAITNLRPTCPFLNPPTNTNNTATTTTTLSSRGAAARRRQQHGSTPVDGETRQQHPFAQVLARFNQDVRGDPVKMQELRQFLAARVHS